MSDAPNGARFFNVQMRVMLAGVQADESPDAVQRRRAMTRQHMSWMAQELKRIGNPKEPGEWVALVPALVQAKILVGDLDASQLAIFREPLDDAFRALVTSVGEQPPPEGVRITYARPTDPPALPLPPGTALYYEGGTLRKWAEQLIAEEKAC